MVSSALFVRQQGVTFAIVIVKRYVIDNSFEADRAIASFQPLFPGRPVVLVARTTGGPRPTTVAGTSRSSWPACP